MVTVVAGVYGIITTAGLSSAAIQKATVTNEQISTLFWINILVGMVLSLLCLATAPVLVAFYHEPRLFWVTVVTGTGFLFSAAGVQHSALLQRQLRYNGTAWIHLEHRCDGCGAACLKFWKEAWGHGGAREDKRGRTLMAW